jgi:hypothetical protein
MKYFGNSKKMNNMKSKLRCELKILNGNIKKSYIVLTLHHIFL